MAMNNVVSFFPVKTTKRNIFVRQARDLSPVSPSLTFLDSGEDLLRHIRRARSKSPAAPINNGGGGGVSNNPTAKAGQLGSVPSIQARLSKIPVYQCKQLRPALFC